MSSKILSQPSKANLPQPPLTNHLSQKLGAIGKALAQLLFVTPQNALSVQKRQHKNQTTWIVRDRRLQTRQKFTSEEDLRVWLEQRYHR